jgi:hypothetical protein
MQNENNTAQVSQRHGYVRAVASRSPRNSDQGTHYCGAKEQPQGYRAAPSDG